MNRAKLSLLLLAAVAASTVACSGAPDEEGVASDEALTGTQLPDVAGIQFEVPNGAASKVVTLGAKPKVKKALGALKKPTGSTHTPLCSFGRGTKMTFFGAGGDKIAEGSLTCYRGTVTITATGRQIPIYTRPGDLSVLDEALVPADALWGISKVHIQRLAGPSAEVDVTDQATITSIVAGFRPGQAIDARAPVPSCLPSHVVSFYRGASDAAYASFVCGTGNVLPAEVSARFTIPAAQEGADDLASGRITIDPRPVAAALADQAR